MFLITNNIFLASGLLCVFFMFLATGIVTAAAVGGDLEDSDYLPDDGELVLYTRDRRVPASVVASSADVPAASGDVKWTLGLGVLSNMQQFFDSLRTNLESLEQLPQEEREALLGQQVPSASEQGTAFRPKATAAYLHALRNHRPSHKIRNFVSESEPATLRGSNHYDPNWLWTGLGRRR
ncbi:uncharacterized protein LOC110826489 isoform X2 [Zootermopsis nevadensis]|uniref:uncharacterized protein LOC110826489 isoform X2 n=1 Tax=Zootermopsis nevadensis TaxID=136037 RepID=UPI000B8E5D44|nr:uncharacterized protein LOC110826489 isoform X2 [Zootermopsis nevadensis]